MKGNAVHPLKVAILDLYDNAPNQGMRCVQELVARCDGRFYGQSLAWDVHVTRHLGEVPGLDYDIYISSGGPGSPFDGHGKSWEKRYFEWWQAVVDHNQAGVGTPKFVCAICHSFQMMARFFGFGEVTRRHSTSFGILPVHLTAAGRRDPILGRLNDPFFAADFRNWQVVQPNRRLLASLGGEVLALEKVRPHVPLERSLMAVRMSREIIGVQFHPEADWDSVRHQYNRPGRREWVVNLRGLDKYEEIIARLEDPSYLAPTLSTVLPTFLRLAVRELRPERVPAGEMDAVGEAAFSRTGG